MRPAALRFPLPRLVCLARPPSFFFFHPLAQTSRTALNNAFNTTSVRPPQENS